MDRNIHSRGNEEVTRRTTLALVAAGMAGTAGCSLLADGEQQASPTANATSDGDTATRTADDEQAGTPGEGFAIDVPDSVLVDERFTPVVSDAAPVEDVTVRAVVETDGGNWVYEETFLANSQGVVDLSRQSPERSIRSDEMAPIQLLEWQDEGSPEGIPGGPTGEHEVTFTAIQGEHEVSETVTVRHADPGVTEREIETEDVVGWYYEPPGDGPHPALLTLHGSGANVQRSRAALFASHGYATVALQYFGQASAIPDSLEEVPIEYVQGAIDWVLDRPTTTDGAIGVDGVSRGGELALLLASVDDRVDAVVANAGSPYVWGTTASGSAWAVDGEPVPYLDVPGHAVRRSEQGEVLREAFTVGLTEADSEQREAALIDVADATAPILFLSGTDDQMWPATMLGEVLTTRLDAAEYEYEYEHLAYPRAGHGILHPYYPTAWVNQPGEYDHGGSRVPQADAEADAWPRVLDHLDRALASER